GDRVALLIIVGHVIKMLMFIVWSRLLSGRVRESHSTWIVMYFSGLLAGLRVAVIRDVGLWGRPHEYDPEDFSQIETQGHAFPWRGHRVRSMRSLRQKSGRLFPWLSSR